jgi:hypothetical protein
MNYRFHRLARAIELSVLGAVSAIMIMSLGGSTAILIH